MIVTVIKLQEGDHLLSRFHECASQVNLDDQPYDESEHNRYVAKVDILRETGERSQGEHHNDVRRVIRIEMLTHEEENKPGD